MPSPNAIIEPRSLLYEWEIIKLKDKDGNEVLLTVVESDDDWLLVSTWDKTILFPRAFFLKNEDWSYTPYSMV